MHKELAQHLPSLGQPPSYNTLNAPTSHSQTTRLLPGLILIKSRSQLSKNPKQKCIPVNGDDTDDPPKSSLLLTLQGETGVDRECVESSATLRKESQSMSSLSFSNCSFPIFRIPENSGDVSKSSLQWLTALRLRLCDPIVRDCVRDSAFGRGILVSVETEPPRALPHAVCVYQRTIHTVSENQCATVCPEREVTNQPI